MSRALRALVIRIQGDDSSFNRTLRDSRRGLGDFGRDVGRIGTLAAGAVAAAGVAAAVAVGAASRKAIDEAVVWQDHLLFLQTLTGPLPTDELADLDAWLKRLGADYGDLGAVADAAYQAMSAGVPFDQLERFLTVAYRQAVGGRAELTDVVDLLTALQNAWADIDIPWEELSDYISLTKDLGKTSVPELAQFAPEGARAAYDQGLAVQEYLAAIAAMSAVLGHTGRSVTQLRALFAEAGKPASEFSKTLATMSGGLSFRELMDEGRTMIDILADMDWYLEHTGRQWAEILASQEAMGAVGILAGDEASLAKSRSILEAFANAEGAADRAFELMDSGWAAWLRRAKGAWQVQTVEFGEDLLAGLEGAVGDFDLGSFLMSDDFATAREALAGLVVDFGAPLAESLIRAIETAPELAAAIATIADDSSAISAQWGGTVDHVANLEEHIGTMKDGFAQVRTVVRMIHAGLSDIVGLARLAGEAGQSLWMLASGDPIGAMRNWRGAAVNYRDRSWDRSRGIAMDAERAGWDRLSQRYAGFLPDASHPYWTPPPSGPTQLAPPGPHSITNNYYGDIVSGIQQEQFELANQDFGARTLGATY